MNNLIKKGVVVAVILLFFSVSVIPSTGTTSIKQIAIPASSGNTLYVGGSGPNNYTKIQDAIDDATDGDIVYVYNGTYYENVVIDKSINLIGEDRDTTVIGGNYLEDSIYIQANYVKIKGFTIINGNLSGIELWKSIGCSITDNIIISNNYWGIALYGSSNNITGNNISNNGCGIGIYGSSNNITGNNITSNNGCGIGIYGSSNNITGNNITSNNNDGILLRDDSTSNTITGNNISSNNGNGIGIWYSSNNTILKNNFLGNKRHAFFKNCTNTWKQNYWNRPRILPKLIFGIIKIGSKWIPWFDIDWRPAREPYDIDGGDSVSVERNVHCREGVGGYVK